MREVGANRIGHYLGRMNGSISDFLPQIVALLLGGLGVSLGATYVARRPRPQALLTTTGPLAFALICVVIAGAGMAVAWLLIRGLLDTALTEPETLSAGRLLALGSAVGMPLTLPGLIAAWSDARRRERAKVKRRDFVPTKDDRRAYAKQLVEQIQEVSPRPRELTASIAGDGGTTLRFEGDIDAVEGERLTKALSGDLRDVGFKRVEGSKGKREWWSRVKDD